MSSEKGMAFWGFFQDPAPDMNDFPYTAAAGPCALASSPPSSLAPAGGGVVLAPASYGVKASRSASEADNGRSRSGTDHLHGADFAVVLGGDDKVAPELGFHHSKRKRAAYVRHTPHQIHELQAFFEQCSHPDERQRAALGDRLCLRPSQIMYWFQNRRTRVKRQFMAHENEELRRQNDKLRADNLSLRQAMSRPACGACGGPVPAMLRQSPSPGEAEEHLRVHNAALRNELTRYCALASAFLGRPISFAGSQPMPGSPVHRIGGSVPPPTGVGSSTITEFTASPSSSTMGMAITTMVAKAGIDRSVLLELANSAIDELVKMAQMDEPLWIPCVPLPGSLAKETLNYEEYLKNFSPSSMGAKRAGFVSEASRESGIVACDSSAALVEVLLDERRWSGLFSCVIAKSSIVEEISTGVGGSRDGALLLMQAELDVLSPLVPVREVFFLRFCKRLGEGSWAMVDVSVDGLVVEQGLAVASTTANTKCRRLPSGCVVQDTPNGFCRVTWVEHTKYDESSVHQLYQPLVRSGLAFGAGRWLATLQRRYECLGLLAPYVAGLKQESSDVSVEGTRSLLMLAERMMKNFYAGVSASSAEWSKLDGFARNIGGDVRVMARKTVDEPGVPAGVVLCAATSVSMLVTPKWLFNYLCNQGTRAEWDILSKGVPMLEVVKIAKGRQNGNVVSLLKATAPNTHQESSILILQETCTDASGSMVVYSPVDILEMRHVIGGGGDPRSVMLLPSGFVVLPGSDDDDGHSTCGSLLTVAFQILGNSHPNGKLTVESVQNVDRLISCTVNRIKTALHSA